MPNAERRAKQRRARQRDALALAAATAGPEAGNSATPASRRSIASQTVLNEYVVKEIIEKYWRLIDSRRIDQALLPFQFMINTRHGLQSSPSDKHHHSADERAQREGDEQEGEGEDEWDDQYADDFDSEIERQVLEYLLAHEEERRKMRAEQGTQSSDWQGTGEAETNHERNNENQMDTMEAEQRAQSSDWQGTGEAEKTSPERNNGNQMDTMD